VPDLAPLANQPWWVALLYVVVLGHITNVCITLYLHRAMTHEGVRFHPAVEHFMRAWLWLTTATNTREWVACHRKHHAFADREGDPHSPTVEGFWQIMLGGVFFYQRAVKDREMLAKYGKGCPDDWIERKLYRPYQALGLFVMLAVDILLFGLGMGVIVWTGMVIWLPIFGNVINGAGHALGYRNFKTKDDSHNLFPLGIWILGEELHNNHHADPKSAKFKAHWWEFDIGWFYIRLLSFLRLANVIYARSASVKEFTEKYYAEKKLAVGRRYSEAKLEAERRYGEAKLEAERRYGEAKFEAERRYSEARQQAERLYTEAREELNETVNEITERTEELVDRYRPDAKPKPGTYGNG
jgi:stearoyl-CoA desaturase (Delta-9 desaturase)